MKREGILTMSVKEIDKLKIIHEVLQKRLKQRQAARQLGVSTRQVKRLCRRVRREGNRGLIHRLRGLPSNRQLEAGLLEEALDKVKTLYPDFGPTFANEKLEKLHDLVLSVSRLRRGMIQAHLWTPHKHKVKHRAWRERRSCVGELVQLDGSDHPWFEDRGPRCVLLIFIDDATSRILYGEFIPVEDTLNLLRAAKAYLLLHGRPLAFYVDKDSIYKINRQATIEEQLRDEQPLTQFTRAMKELGIEVLAAHSPQAKGRVERGFDTHQDRLVKELRLAGISTMEAANPFLQKVYIPDHNTRCAVEPANHTNAHRLLLASHRLHEILSIRTERVVANDFTLRYHNQFFQITDGQPVRVRPKDTVLVEIRLDGSTHIRFKDRYLDFKPIAKRPHTPFYAHKKAPTAAAKVKPYRPPMSHPFKAASYAKMLAQKSKDFQRLTA
jgi:transposase